MRGPLQEKHCLTGLLNKACCSPCAACRACPCLCSCVGLLRADGDIEPMDEARREEMIALVTSMAKRVRRVLLLSCSALYCP